MGSSLHYCWAGVGVLAPYVVSSDKVVEEWGLLLDVDESSSYLAPFDAKLVGLLGLLATVLQ